MTRKQLLKIAAEVTITLFLLIFGYSYGKAHPQTLAFVERDPALSNPTMGVSTVPNWMLALIAVILPGALYLVLPFLAIRYHGLTIAKESRLRAAIVTGIWLIVAEAQAIGIAMFAVDITKNVAARPRPGFFA
jgi:hypothetical protein